MQIAFKNVGNWIRMTAFNNSSYNEWINVATKNSPWTLSQGPWPVYLRPSLWGYIDVVYGCWRRNVLVTFSRCWWQFWPFWSQKFTIFTWALSTNISKTSPTSLSPFLDGQLLWWYIKLVLTFNRQIFFIRSGIVLLVASPQRLMARRSIAKKWFILAPDKLSSSFIPFIWIGSLKDN